MSLHFFTPPSVHLMRAHFSKQVNMPHASARGDNHKSLTAIIKHDKLRRKFFGVFSKRDNEEDKGF